MYRQGGADNAAYELFDYGDKDEVSNTVESVRVDEASTDRGIYPRARFVL